jgi:RimJ/RimL family protein N-acetyltransferase
MIGVVDRPGEVLTRGPVTLRRWRAADAGAVCDLVLASLEHLRPWLIWAADYRLGQAAEFTQRCERDWESGHEFGYAITTGGVLAGSCGLMARIGAGGLEIGYWVAPWYARRGLATAAAGALAEAAFALPGIDRVEIKHDEANAASAGVPRKLGFTRIGPQPYPGGPMAPAETGIDVLWRLTRPQAR